MTQFGNAKRGALGALASRFNLILLQAALPAALGEADLREILRRAPAAGITSVINVLLWTIAGSDGIMD